MSFINKNGQALNFETVQITSDRLILRPLTLDDAQVIFENFTPEVTHYMTPASPKEIEETLKFLRSTTSKRKQNKEIAFAICNPETRDFLGVCGLHRIDTPHPELGIWLKQAAHGNQYGREAVTAVVHWANQHLNFEYLVYPVDRNNIPSRKIPESLHGEIFKEYLGEKMDGGTLDLVVYKISPQNLTR